MFCPECGWKNVDGAAFCENCGTKLAEMPGYEAPVEKTAEKKKSVISKMMLVEIPVAVVCLILFVFVFQSKFSAESVVKRYVEGMGEADWNQVYDTLYIKDKGEFMTKQAFVTAQSINGRKLDEDLEVEDVRKKTSKIYRVKYEGDLGEQRMDVKVKRSGLTWKVDEADTFITKDFSVAVPKDAKIKIDGITPSASEKSQDAMEGMDTYTIKKMYGSSHYVEISGSDIETTSALIEKSTEPVVMTAGYSKDVVEQIADQAVRDLNTIFKGAAADKRFSDIDVLNNMYADQKDSAIRKYENVRDNEFENGDNSWKFISYQITNCEAEAQMITKDQKSLIEVTIKGDASWEKTYTYWSGNKETRTETEDARHTLYYINDSGTWKLYDLDLWSW